MRDSRATLDVVVTAELATVHLPPERQVLMTPAIVGLAELCIASSEDDETAWRSTQTSLRHRAGVRIGELVHLAAIRDAAEGAGVTWQVEARSDDGTLVADGTITRQRTA